MAAVLTGAFPTLHSPLSLGAHVLPNRLFVAPMAGVTDRPFRQLCRRLGAGHAVSEMVTSRPELQRSLKTSRRANHEGEAAPIAVQIAGTDAAMMAEAAVHNIRLGAHIIDINMGCPAKKVCNKWAGSALMQNEALAEEIAAAVVQAAAPFGVPVTLKMRTGWDNAQRNAVTLARRFESVGIQLLTVHGRTREQGYRGRAEYATIAAVKRAVSIPVVANGDIDSPVQARAVLAATGADALMVGRAAQGRPWIFAEILHELRTGQPLAPPLVAQVYEWLMEHLQDHYRLYGSHIGALAARKHIAWYTRSLPDSHGLRQRINALTDPLEQQQALREYFERIGQQMQRLPALPTLDARMAADTDTNMRTAATDDVDG